MSSSASRLRHVIVGAALVLVAPVLLTGCSKGPSKSQAFEAIQSGVKEDGSCTLPVDILSRVKMQYATKGICVPKEGAEKARTCIDALVAAGVTKRMPDAYMLAWPDEVATASLVDIPAYERRARNLVYSECVELAGELRDGRFGCAVVQAEKVLRVTALDDTHADVAYERNLALKPLLTAIDAACGTVTRPPGEATVAFSKTAGTWGLASLAPAGDGGGGASGAN
jgi:hypothetical protein